MPALRPVVPERCGHDVRYAYQLRTALWADDRLREEFLAQRGATVGADERALIASWKHRKHGEFVVYKHLRSHSIFMSDGVFAVLGLYSPLAEVARTVPSFVEAVLLPFGDRIITDGLVSSPGVQLSFGPGMSSLRRAVRGGASSVADPDLAVADAAVRLRRPGSRPSVPGLRARPRSSAPGRSPHPSCGTASSWMVSRPR